MERDYNLYFELMQNALDEKYKYIAEYLHKNKKIETLVDFGCADGALLRRISKDFPNIQLIGIDKPEIVKLYLKNEMAESIENITFMTEDDFFKTKTGYQNYGLILSSVLHELYSTSFIFNFLEDFYENAKVIFIRDMFFTDTQMIAHETMSFLELDAVKNNVDFYEKFRKQFQFYDHTISNLEVAEFLMKYPYKRNWENELKENYFSVPWHHIHYTLAKDFELQHIRPHMNEFILKRTFDMGFNLYRYTTTTHIELIFEKK